MGENDSTANLKIPVQGFFYLLNIQTPIMQLLTTFTNTRIHRIMVLQVLKFQCMGVADAQDFEYIVENLR